mmetsp:Transcript_24196/g.29344  ORF Transcript_24196/g.29344 Transcript_24196/m.29344 type:complete len:310 (+) Transcript_24196:675-1604(+)
MGSNPLFSASAMGIASRASAKARKAYCSTPGTSSAAFSTASAQAISADPPPYTTLLSRMRLRATQIESCRLRLISSRIILFPPRQKMVTALLLWQSSITTILSFVVPNAISFTRPAFPSFASVSSWKRGTIRPPVAIASSSSSTPPTQRIAGSSLTINKWLASSSKPHWQQIRFAPESLHCWTMSVKYFFSAARRVSNFSTVSMSTLCLVFGLGGSKGQVRIAIFASLISFCICGWLMSLSRMRPRTSLVSSSFPPTLPSSLIKSRFTSFLSKSATAKTASTHILAISFLHRPTILEESVVMHVFTSGS